MRLTNYTRALLAERRAQRGILPETPETAQRRRFDYMVFRHGEQFATEHYAANGLKVPHENRNA